MTALSTSRGEQPALPTRVARELGVGRGELAGKRWRSPYRGIQVPASPAAGAPLQRILDAAELLPPGAAIGGWAAAHLLGVRDLDGRGATGRDTEPVPIILPPPLSIRRRPGLALWRSPLADDDVTVVDGVACTLGVRTGFDLARNHQLRQGVVCLDALGRSARVLPAAVLAYAEEHRGWKGVPTVRAAVELADPRARSCGETRFRLLWVLDAALPRPEVNPDVFDAVDFFLGMVDLLDPESGLVGEYDGALHRDPRTHADDNAREEWLEDSGLVVVRAGGVDVGPERRRTVARLQVAHRRAAAQSRHKDWWHRPRPMPAAS